jgi:hypothetical protein
MMDKFSVYLYSRGNLLAHGLIRTRYTLHAEDDVDAAMSAKEKARKEFPNRDANSWFAELVEKREDHELSEARE